MDHCEVKRRAGYLVTITTYFSQTRLSVPNTQYTYFTENIVRICNSNMQNRLAKQPVYQKMTLSRLLRDLERVY